MSIPAARPQVLDCFGTPLVVGADGLGGGSGVGWTACPPLASSSGKSAVEAMTDDGGPSGPVRCRRRATCHSPICHLITAPIARRVRTRLHGSVQALTRREYRPAPQDAPAF